MTFEEINHMPPLEMQKTTYQWIRGPQCIQISLDPEAFQKFPYGWNKTWQANSKNLKEGEPPANGLEGPQGIPMSPNQKAFQKLPIKVE